MSTDRIGDTLRTARNLGNLTNRSSILRDAIRRTDRDDLYRFTLSSSQDLSFTARQLKTGAQIGVELYSLKRPRGQVLRAIGRIPFSQLRGAQIQRHLFTVVQRSLRQGQTAVANAEPREFFLRVRFRGQDSNYRLQATSAQPATVEPPVPPVVPPVPPIPPVPPSPPPVAGQFTQQWIRQLGTPANDYAYGVAVVGGNVYLSGSTEGDLSGANRGNRDSYAALYSDTGVRQWQRQFGTSGLDVASDIIVDSTGNYYVSGIDVVNQNIPFVGQSPNPNGYASKFGSNGNALWQPRVDISTQVSLGLISVGAADAAAGIALDSTGTQIYVTGLVRGVPNIPPVSGNPSEVFVARYSTTSNEQWFRRFTLAKSSGASSIAVDAAGNVYVAGVTNADLTSDTSNIDTPFIGGDAFVAKLSADGTRLWERTITSSATDYARGIAVDAAGSVYVTGDTDGSLPGQIAAGNRDGFVAKFDTNGSQQWIRQFGTSGLDESQGIAVNTAGQVYLVGETTGALFSNTPLGQSDAWLAEVDPANGGVLRSTLVGTAGNDEAYGIATDTSGRVYVVGQTQGAFAGATNQGQYDAWVTQYI